MKKITYLLAILLLVKIIPAAAQQSGGEEKVSPCEAANADGIAAYKDGKYGEAVAKFEESRKCRLEEYNNIETPASITCLDNIAYVYSSTGKYGEAVEIYEKTLPLWKELAGEDDERVALANENLAYSYTGIGEYKKALGAFEIAMAWNEKKFGADSEEAAMLLYRMARLHFFLQEQQKALEEYQRTFDIIAKKYGGTHLFIAGIKTNMGIIYQDLGEFKKALQSFEDAYSIYAAGKGEDSADAASSLVAIGGAKASLGRHEEALADYAKAVKVFAAAGDDALPDLANAYNNIATSLQTFGDYAKSLEYFKEALAIEEKISGPESQRVAQRYNNIGYIYYFMGDYASSLENYNRALEIKKKIYGPRHSDVALTLNNIALVYKIKGDYTTAAKFYTEALEITQEVYGDAHPGVAVIYDNLGNVYDAKGESEKGLRNHLKAYEIFKAAYGENHSETSIALNNIAAAYDDMEQYGNAIEYYLRSYNVYAAIGGENQPEAAKTLDNLGVIYRKTGENEKALEYHLKALEVFKRVLGDSHQDTGITYNNIAIALDALGRSEEAINYYGEVLRIWIKVFGENNQSVGLAHNNIGVLFQNNRMHEEAAREFRMAQAALCGGKENASPAECFPEAATVNAFWFSARSLYALGRYEESAAEFEKTADALDMLRGEMESQGAKKRFGGKYYDMFPQGVAAFAEAAGKTGGNGYVNRAFVFAEKGIGRVFLEMLGRSQANFAGGLPQEVVKEGEALSANLAAAAAALNDETSKPKEYQNQESRRRAYQRLYDSQSKMKEHEQRLLRDYPSYADMMRPSPRPLDEVRAAVLRPGEAALEYVLGEERSYLFVITKDSAKLARLPEKQKIENLVKIFRTKLLNPAIKEDSLRKSASNLYEALIAPAEGELAGIKSLLIVPSGELFFLPFEALEREKDGKAEYMLKEYSIRYAPGLNVLYLSSIRETAKSTGKGWIGFGDPVYARDDPRVSGSGAGAVVPAETGELIKRFLATEQRGGASIPRIPATGVEVEAVGEIIKGKTGSGGAHVGLGANESDVKNAAKEGYGIVHIASHGTLGAGDGFEPALILSTVGDMKGEDGFLKMSEVFDMKMDSDIVVLSACETGRGALEKGEGVAGMSRAFLYSGAKSLVVSLWSVADTETKDLMISFYKNLDAGMTAEDSLRRAKTEMADRGLSPYFWAPFILNGGTK